MQNKPHLPKYITRREFLKHGLSTGLTTTLLGGLVFTACAKKQANLKPKNIILISIDTLRADHLGCYGYHRPTSPMLDKIASQGLLFEDVSTASPWTLPAHASMLTGLYPSRHGLKSHDIGLPPHVVTLAETLKKHDFYTGAVINSIQITKRYGFNRGFDDFTYVKEKPDQIEPSNVENEAYDWLEKHHSKPFFLFLHYYDVHSDYCSLPQYEEQFVRPYNGQAKGSTIYLMRFTGHARYLGKGLLPKMGGNLPNLSGESSAKFQASLQKLREEPEQLNQTDTEHLINLYDAGIRQMDDGIERMVRFLEQKQLLENTLIILTSDHGEEFLEHGGFLHGQKHFQEALHVPLIIRGPGIPKGRRIRQAASLVDLMPTMLGILGIPNTSTRDGINLQPTWQKTDSKLPHRPIFAEADQGNFRNDIKRAVKYKNYKLHYNVLTKKHQLYDLSNDPAEKNDIASEQVAITNMLLNELQQFMKVDEAGQKLAPLSQEEIQKLKSLGYLQ